MLALANAEVLPFNHADAGREIQAAVTRLATAVGQHLDLSPALAEAGAFLEVAEQLEAAKGRAAGGPAERVNETLMRISRTMVPVVYSQGGRFHHDPAELSPVMRATGQFTLPGLSKAAALPGLSGGVQFGFLRAQVTRERNRLVTALRHATRLARDTLQAL